MTILLIIVILFTNGDINVQPIFHMETEKTCEMAGIKVAQQVAENLDLDKVKALGYVCKPVPPWFPVSQLGPES